MLFLITIIVVYAPLFVSPSPQNFPHHGFISTLKHVDSDKNLTKIELLQLAAKRGRERMKRLEARMLHVDSPTTTHDVTFASRVQEFDYQYSINLSIGTPKQLSFTVQIDTGSDLIWTLCKPYYKKSTPIFDPKISSSYFNLNCASDLCQALRSRDRNCTKCGECMYKLIYEDQSYTRGVLSTETFTFDGNVKVPNIGFGCAFDMHGNFGPNQGLVGLGRRNASLVSQMKETKFSYCLPTYGSNETGLLSMGSLASIPRGAKTTPILKHPLDTNSYYLSLQGITIGKTKLPINKTNFEIKGNGDGGLIIDSGTSLTYLEKSAFDQVKQELTYQIKLPSFDGSNDFDFELCYNITRPMNKIKLPKLILHFQGQGANFEVIPENYFDVVDEEEKVGCLMMGSSPFPDGTSIFGNYQQQNALVVYDLANNKLFFKTSTKCNK